MEEIQPEQTSYGEEEPFTVEDLDKVLQKVRPGAGAGYDNISPEFLKHLGPLAR